MAVKKGTTKKRTSSKKPAKRKKKNLTIKQKCFKFLKYSFWIGTILLSFFVLTIFLEFWGPLPNEYELKKVRTATASEVISADGQVLGRIYLKNRTNVDINDISPYVVKALVPTEDARFFKHHGVDKRSLLRVFFKTLLMGDRSSGGGSTLSQQLAKNIYPRGDYGIFSMPAAKLREAIIATRFENIYNKQEVLNLYLNTVPFGEDTYGIEEGAKRFFSKPAKELKLEEAAVLVGMLKAPTRYNPRLFPERSLHRRNVVLNQMVKYELITKEQAEKTKLLPIKLKYKRVTTSDGDAAYLRERIRVEVSNYLKDIKQSNGEKYNLYTDGLRIYTTIDSRMQRHAEKSMRQHMTYLQGVFDRHWRGRSPWGKSTSALMRVVKQSDRYRRMKRQGHSHDEIIKNFKSKTNTSIFTWKGMVDKRITPWDSVKHTLQILQTGLLSMDPRSGAIKAYIGGIDHRHFKYDHTTSKRQVGSTFKPFVYLSAMRKGLSPFAYYKNERKTYPEYQNWSPANAEDHYTGYYSMEGALAESVNTIAVEMILQSGIENTINLVKSMGIDSELPEYPSLALGAANISLWEMVTAYACMANGGMRVDPHYMLRIEDNKGRVIANFESEIKKPVRVLTKNEAKVINHMLQSVVKTGTARSLHRIYGLKNNMAGKTGTTNDYTDGWFMGYSPSLVTGVWTGGDDVKVRFRNLTLGQGGHMALPIFARYIRGVVNDGNFPRIANESFPPLTWSMRADLNIPHYTEELNRKQRKKRDFEQSDKPDANKLAETRERQVEEQKKKGGFFKMIKNIFKKKK